ncbi:MAG: prolyl oligopeptidase family serine peptidase [Saprospiraceae bacterium]|nr:prolyl oligopeptidase family serine peptidase [Saprospiraceae bacterium]
MKKVFLFIFIFISGYISDAQELISVTLKGSRTKLQLTQEYSNPFIRNGAKYYSVLYTSPDAKGNKDTLSGLMVIPDDFKFKYPKLIYQHGTSDCKKCVPSFFGSNGADEGEVGLIGCGMGYVTFLPDYVGMGNGRGFQTYVHAATIQSATDNFLKATESWLSENGVSTNSQLFITGYSQGGYASMAYHKYLEDNGRKVTAAAHLSGPYSLSGVMRNLILSDQAYLYPAYIPNTALGMQESYGNLYNDLSDIFKPEFIPDIQAYYNGTITLTNLNIRIIQKLNSLFGNGIAKNMLQPAFLDQLQTNPESPINKALSENDIYKWAPKAPTKIYYCMADDQVPFMNSVVANDTMKMLGAADLETRNVNTTANHGACFNPALNAKIRLK